MKSSGLMQLTVQVGTCSIPQLPYQEYSLTVRLLNTNSAEKDITASTTFKPNEGNCINFATKLFLRIEKGVLEHTPSCCVIVTGINQKSSRCQVGRGEAKTCGEGIQSVRMKVRQAEDSWLQAKLQFCTSMWQVKQTKTNNNRMSIFKSQLSQKQSSSEQKQSHPSKTSTILTLNEHNQPKQKSADSHPKTMVKESKSQKILPQLQNSTATTKDSGKNQQHNFNRTQSELILTMQIKINSLQEKITFLQDQLRAINNRMKESEGLLQDQQRQRVKLQETKEQLSQLLILEEQKNNICLKHIERLSKLIETLSNPQENSFQLIQQRDEIIMMNQELQKELINKNITINQMKNEIQQLHNKIISFQSLKLKNTPSTHQQPKVLVSSGKIIGSQKPKVEKRSSERNITQKRSEEMPIPNKPKDTKKFKQKQIKESKNDLLANTKKPAIPKNPREVKSPMTPKNEGSLSMRTQKPKTVKLKVQQKATMQTQKQSQMEQSMQSLGSLNMSNNLMIDSRSKEVQLSGLKQC